MAKLRQEMKDLIEKKKACFVAAAEKTEPPISRLKALFMGKSTVPKGREDHHCIVIIVWAVMVGVLVESDKKRL
jgi:hypothetical protein